MKRLINKDFTLYKSEYTVPKGTAVELLSVRLAEDFNSGVAVKVRVIEIDETSEDYLGLLMLVKIEAEIEIDATFLVNA